MKALQYLAITAAALVCNPSILRAQETFDEPVPPPAVPAVRVLQEPPFHFVNQKKGLMCGISKN